MSSAITPFPWSLTTVELVKMSLPIIFFSILLPFVDTITDLRMIFRLYRGIPGCQPYDDMYYGDWYLLQWQEEYTCREDPDIYCETNPDSWQCSYFYEYGDPYYIPGCEWDINICYRDSATFCESKPDSPFCKNFKHTTYGLMFLGKELKEIFSFIIHRFFSTFFGELFYVFSYMVQT